MCKTILVLNRYPAIRMLYEDELTEEGYDVITRDGSSKLMRLIGKTVTYPLSGLQKHQGKTANNSLPDNYV